MTKADAQTITANDPVETAAITCGQLERAYLKIEESTRRLRDGLRAKSDDELSALIQRKDSLKEYASWLSARTEIGALFQLGIIHEALDDVADAELGSFEQRTAIARVRRCLHSVRRLLEPRGGTSLADIGLDLMLPASSDEAATLEKHAAGG